MKKLILSLLILGLTSVTTISAAPQKIYGPVKSGETLWAIAYKTRPSGISRLQMMKAIHKANPGSFEKGNINLLSRGAKLNVPQTSKEVTSILKKSNTVEASRRVIKGGSTVVDTKGTRRVAKLEAELAKVKSDLNDSRKQLKGLEKIEKRGMVESLSKKLSKTSDELKESKQQIALLKGQNQQLKNMPATGVSKDPKVEEIRKELLSAKEQLGALEVQNQLLREQTKEVDKEKQAGEDDPQVSETIAALHADISQLRARIKELEEIEKLKDAHISELKKSLDHATVVIKEQAEVNKKMYARLNELEESSNKTAKAVAAIAAGTAAAGAVVKSKEASREIKPVIEKSSEVINEKVKEPAQKDSKASTTTFSTEKSAKTENPFHLASEEAKSAIPAMQHISPKFWIILSLACLLLMLTLLWRMILGRASYEKDEA